MSQVSKQTLVLMPSEYLCYSLGRTPRYSPNSALESVRTVTITENTVESNTVLAAAPAMVTEKERMAVEQWVMQLVRKTLGPALTEVENEMGKACSAKAKGAKRKTLPTTLRLTIDAISASIITEAMRRAGRKEEGAPAPERK
jgi:hypothetical protein